jgi:uncharacterized DUF497 family protein
MLRFDWDAGNREKCRKHGVSTAEIEAMLSKPFAVFPDPAHSGIEERFKAIGTNEIGRYIFAVFTLRSRSDGLLIRPISARYMRRKEVVHYEKEIAKAQEQ